MMHFLVRTSPKGEPFVGTCSLCGKTGITLGASSGHCDNLRGLTADEVVLEAITGAAAKEAGGS